MTLKLVDSALSLVVHCSFYQKEHREFGFVNASFVQPPIVHATLTSDAFATFPTLSMEPTRGRVFDFVTMSLRIQVEICLVGIITVGFT